LASFFKANYLIATGRLRFPRKWIGQHLVLPDGRDYVVFRHVVLTPGTQPPLTPGAIFIPTFHVAGMSPGVNKRFSLLPIPFIVGLPGFRTKLWLLQEQSGDFAGLYEWDTVQDAENYNQSFAMRFMANRSLPESVSSRVFHRAEWESLPNAPITGSQAYE
jgi:hypothetical protein